MVSLHGFFILILSNQIINQLSYSVVYAPFQVHTDIIYQAERKSQTYVRIFSKNLQNFFRSYPQGKGELREKIKTDVQRFNESSPAARRKGDPQAVQRERLFRGGAFCRCAGFVAVCSETAVLLRCLRRSVFELERGVSLSAAARSAAALVYDKLTPNCQQAFYTE